MATQVQFRRGTTSQTETFIGALGEITVDTSLRTAVIHDGVTAGGNSLLKSDGSKIPINEYDESEEWKKYEREWLKWWEKGDWNSPNIPKKYKVGLGFEDLSKISEK